MYAGLHIYIMPIPRGIAPSESSFSPQTMEIDYDPPICKNMVIVVGSWLIDFCYAAIGGRHPWLAGKWLPGGSSWLVGWARAHAIEFSLMHTAMHTVIIQLVNLQQKVTI
jgi:hypothetical protein